MRVDYTPFPHECKLPPAAGFPVGTVVTCDDAIGQMFNGRSYVDVTCGTQWVRGVTMWLRDPTWVKRDPWW